MALVTIRAVTTLLTPEQYGELALLIAVQMFCGLLLVNPVGQHINLHTHAWWDDGTLMARLKSYKRYVLVVSLVGGVVVIAAGKPHSVDQLFWIAVTMFAMVCAGTWNATLIPMLNMLGFRAASVLLTIVTAAVSLISSISLVNWQPTATAWFAGQAIGFGVGALGAGYVLKSNAVRSQHSLNKQSLLNRSTISTYCLPLAVATGFMWLQLSGYRFLIEHYWGLAQLGFLAVGLQLAAQIWALAESLAMQFLYPLFYRRVSEHQKQDEVELAFSDLLNTLVPVYFVLSGLLVLCAPYLLTVLVAPQFHGGAVFVMLGAAIELCRVLGNLFSNAAHVKRKTKSLAFPYAIGSVTTLSLIWFTGAWEGEIKWACVALMVGAIAMVMSMWVGMKRQVQFTLDFGRWVWGGTIMLAMALLAFWMPKASGSTAAICLLLFASVPTGVATWALLWNNPAVQRLLNVRLRKS
jgi:O-antigen/teichoic acid export membrane protein